MLPGRPRPERCRRAPVREPMEMDGRLSKERSMNGRSMFPMISAAVLAAHTMSGAAGASGKSALAADGSATVARRAHGMRFFNDTDGPKVRLEDGREYPLMPLTP